MTEDQFNVIHDLMGKIVGSLRQIAETTARTHQVLNRLDIGSRQGGDVAPNYIKPLSEYETFKWDTINAEVIDSDRDGATTVEWKGRQFTRRRGNPDYEPVVYFSRSTGKDKDTGKHIYEWLITFRQPSKAKRLPEETKEAIEAAAAKASTHKRQQPAGAEGATLATVATTTTGRSASANDGVVCSLRSWDSLTQAVNAAAKVGVTPEKWKPRVEKITGTTDMRSLNDADVAKAINAIKMMTAEAAAASVK